MSSSHQQGHAPTIGTAKDLLSTGIAYYGAKFKLAKVYYVIRFNYLAKN